MECERCHESHWRAYAQHGSYGYLCASCGAQGWATSLIAVLPKDHSKARMSVDQSPGEEVVGSVAAYQEWIMERSYRGNRVWIEFCSCEGCGGSISVEVVDQMVRERCRSCQQEIQYVSTVPLPYKVPLETRHYRVRHPQPDAEVIALVRKMISPELDHSIQTVKERLESDEGVVITCRENCINPKEWYMDLYVRDCQIERISGVPGGSPSQA